jgi:protein-disulfide isomerase
MVLAASVHAAILFALAGGSLIFVAVVVALFFAVAYGYYTRTGSGISQTPYRRPDGPPESPSELAHDTTQDLRNWERGTAGHHRPSGAHQLPESVAQALADWRTGPGTAPVLDPPIGSADHVRGPEEAPTLTVYLDVSSQPCRSAYRLLSELADAQEIRLAVRQLPLADVHELSLAAAEALEAAAVQGKFFELLDRLASSGARDETELLDLATRSVADPDRLELEVRAGRYRAAVVEQIHQATASGAHAVPEIYINGTHYGEPIKRDDLDRKLRDARDRRSLP